MASVAPSFAGYFDMDPRAVLQRIGDFGFDAVEETALALEFDHGHGQGFGASCPRVVALARREFPHVAPLFRAGSSALSLHCRDIRRRFGSQAVIVFFGPCRYKNWESLWGWDHPDRVVTFSRLARLLSGAAKGVPERKLTLGPRGLSARVTAPADAFLKRAAVLAAEFSGLDAVRTYLSHGPNLPGPVELLACAGGCLAGPGAVDGRTLAQRRDRVLQWATREVDGHAVEKSAGMTG